MDIRAQVIRNLLFNPGSEVSALANEGTGAGTPTRDTTRFLFGSASTKFVWSSGTIGLSVARFIANTLRPLNRYSIAFWVYLESGAAPSFVIQNSSYGTLGTTMAATAVLGRWTRYTATFTTDSSASLRIYNASNEATTYYVDGAIMVEGSTVPEIYQDGNTPGWKWDGTPGASTSYGYPYTLASIAGIPLGDLSVPGSVLALSNAVSTGPFSMYLVADHLLELGAFGDYNSGLNVNAATGFTVNTGAALSRTNVANSVNARIDTGSGTGQFNQTVGLGNVGVGRHILSLRINDGLTLLRYAIDDQSIQKVLIPGTIQRNQLRLDDNSPNASQLSLRLVAYEADHSDVTKLAIHKWLGNRYGLAA